MPQPDTYVGSTARPVAGRLEARHAFGIADSYGPARIISVVKIVVRSPIGLMLALQYSTGSLVNKGYLSSGWRDLNSRPLDPQIGRPWLSSLNHLSLVSMVDR